METKVFTIQGMSCDHCKQAVTNALTDLSGVNSVEVDLEGGKATVAYDPGQTNEADMKKAIEEAGYEVVTD